MKVPQTCRPFMVFKGVKKLQVTLAGGMRMGPRAHAVTGARGVRGARPLARFSLRYSFIQLGTNPHLLGQPHQPQVSPQRVQLQVPQDHRLACGCGRSVNAVRTWCGWGLWTGTRCGRGVDGSCGQARAGGAVRDVDGAWAEQVPHYHRLVCGTWAHGVKPTGRIGPRANKRPLPSYNRTYITPSQTPSSL